MKEQLNEELVALFRDESTREKAFSELVKRFQETTYWHIRYMVGNHEDANDIMQEVFIKVWRHLEKFRGDSEFGTWLRRIATNETLSFLEKQKKTRSTSVEDPASFVGGRLRSEEGFDYKKVEWIMQMGLQELTEKQRAAFCLRYYDDLSYDEMGYVLGISSGGAKALYHIALKNIQEFLKKYLDVSQIK